MLKNTLDLSRTEQAKRGHAEIGQAIRNGSKKFSVGLALHLWVGCDIRSFIPALSVESVAAGTTGCETPLAGSALLRDDLNGRLLAGVCLR